MGEKQESSEPVENNADDQKDEDANFLNRQQSSINYNNSHKTDDDKPSSKQASSSSSPISQNADAQEDDSSPKTKSGRKVQKPVLFIPEAKKSQSDKRSKTSGKRQRRFSNVSHNVASQNSQQNTLSSASSPEESPNMEVSIKIEQEPEQVVADDTVCIICHDGNSPKHNRIVLCDKCDTPYHQRCHKPSIENRVVEIPDAEWICSKCDDLRGRKRRKVEISATTVSTVGSSSRSYSSEISGDGLTEDQKIAYLSSLPQRVLIDLILIAEKLHPDLPLYPADVKEKIANNAYASDRGSDPRVLTNSTALPHQSFMSQMSIPSQPTQSYSPSSINNNLSRAHLPAVGIDLPSYEEMIVQALASIADPAGSAPRNIFEWMNSSYPLHKNFRASASQALQKAVKKGRVFRIGTVYKINPNYRPAKRTRRFFKRPSSNEPSAYKEDDDDDDDDDDILETDSHGGHDGIYEIAVRLDDNDNFTSVHSLDMEEHPSLTSSAVSSPLPNAISSGHTAVTSPEANSPLDDMPNKIVSVMINEPSASIGSIMSNQSILSPVMGRNIATINNSTDLSSTLLHPPVQQTLPPLSSVNFFGSGYVGNKQNSTFYSPSQTGNYNIGLPSIYNISLSRDRESVQRSGNSSAGAMHLQ
uniref:Histone H1 n=2 Tax=Rhizophagus irregularis TaxID=588596 RepID=U9UVV7_RHIID